MLKLQRVRICCFILWNNFFTPWLNSKHSAGIPYHKLTTQLIADVFTRVNISVPDKIYPLKFCLKIKTEIEKDITDFRCWFLLRRAVFSATWVTQSPSWRSACSSTEPSPADTSARSSISRRILLEPSWESQTLAEVSRPFFNAYSFMIQCDHSGAEYAH